MNKTKKIVMALLLTGFVLFAMTGTATAENYYVSTHGDNSNDGKSMSNAFSTVKYGSSILTAGDTLFIDGGTYWNDKIQIERSGTKNNWITVTNYNGEKVKMYHSEEFNSEKMMSFVDISYIKVENIETSHYGSCCYISGKYNGDTHHITIINVDSLRSYSRGYACNGGAHNIHFENILIKDVEHPTSSPNGFDFLTSPHDEGGNPHTDYCIHDITLINVDIDYVESHNGFNFGQGVSVEDYSQHWEGELCENFHFNDCDVTGAAGAGYYTNKYVLRNSIIEDCEVTGCWNGLGLIGDDLLIKNVHSHDNDMNDLFFLWDARSHNVVIECFQGDPPGLSNEDGFTIIECGEKKRVKPDRTPVIIIGPDTINWMEEYIGEDSDEGDIVTTVELQHAFHHWAEDIPVRDHLLTTEDLQNIIILWKND